MQDLINAYNSTSYNIFRPELSITIGQINSEVDDLLERHNCIEWAFITASNPFSQMLNEEENLERHKQLYEELGEYHTFEGEGVGTDPEWKPEQSSLILGISEKNAVKLGVKFQQNAIVLGRLKEVARLMLLEDELKKGH